VGSGEIGARASLRHQICHDSASSTFHCRRFCRLCINLALLAILATGIESLGSKSQSWLINGVVLLTGQRIAIAVIVGIAVVFGLAGWRWFSGAAEKPQVARPAAPVAKPATPAAAAATEPPALLTQLESTQQNVVDDLQFMQSRVAKQDAEIKRLRAELEALSQRYDTLTSFASTPKEAKSEPAVAPPKKKKKRFVRRTVKKKPAA
jgi:hypothetical protein